MIRPLAALLLVVLAVTLAPAPPTDAQSKTLVVTAYGEIRSEFFGPNPPASTLVQISNLAIPDALIEIEAVAVVD